MRLIVLAIAIAISGQLAKADIYSDCTNAIKRQDIEKAKELASTLMRFNSFSISEQAAGAACMTFAMGEEYAYSYTLNTFAPQDEEAARLEESKKAAAEQAVDQKKKLAAADELNRLHHQAELEAAAAKDAQTAAVWKRVYDACGALYRSDPDRTVTNQICLNVFLETGLPAE